jgi:hypothetical protein
MRKFVFIMFPENSVKVTMSEDKLNYHQFLGKKSVVSRIICAE